MTPFSRASRVPTHDRVVCLEITLYTYDSVRLSECVMTPFSRASRVPTHDRVVCLDITLYTHTHARSFLTNAGRYVSVTN